MRVRHRTACLQLLAAAAPHGTVGNVGHRMVPERVHTAAIASRAICDPQFLQDRDARHLHSCWFAVRPRAASILDRPRRRRYK